ncbi:MAG TPA: c-type cytochrome [Paraburkholderia sp.]|nr:c-type cytochrome [Paraburkholderia sp.]
MPTASAASEARSNASACDHAQVARGLHLYSESCAKCHGTQLEGIIAPAPSGPAFAPAENSHLTPHGNAQRLRDISGSR